MDDSREDANDEAPPRVGWCWGCESRLRRPHFVERVIDGHPRVLHKGCAEVVGGEAAKETITTTPPAAPR